jgi:uncharacterized protein (TIGR00251 family)
MRAPPLPPRASLIKVRVKPGSRASALRQQNDGFWLAELKSPPVDGKANAELIALIAQQFKCPRSAVTIKTGHAGRHKLVKIENR